jgi:hypothetical protein
LNPDLGEPITSLTLQTPQVARVAGDIVPVTVRTTMVGRIVNVGVAGGERVGPAGGPVSGPVGDGDVIYVRSAEAGRVRVAVDAHAEVRTGRIFRADPKLELQAQILARTGADRTGAFVGIAAGYSKITCSVVTKTQLSAKSMKVDSSSSRRVPAAADAARAASSVAPRAVSIQTSVMPS